MRVADPLAEFSEVFGDYEVKGKEGLAKNIEELQIRFAGGTIR